MCVRVVHADLMMYLGVSVRGKFCLSSYSIVSMSVSVVYSIILLSAVIVLGNSYFVFWLRSGSKNICEISGIKKAYPDHFH